MGLAGCFGPRAYPCETDEECQLDGRSGFCEAERYCSLPDDRCDSNRRFSEHAPADLANVCVGEGEGGSSTTTDGGSDGPMPECEGEDCGCAAQLVVSDDKSCVVTIDDRLLCWGDNLLGSVAPASGSESIDRPTLVEFDEDEVSSLDGIVFGDDHACGLINGGVRCWGKDRQGQVSGNAQETMDTQLPTLPIVSGVNAAIDVAAGRRWSCALVSDGTQIRCWGTLAGQSDTQWVIDANRAVVELTMTHNGLCARAENGDVLCAGAASKLPGPWELEALNPVPGSTGLTGVGSISDAVGLASSADLFCAWTDEDPSVSCWGINNSGEAGVEAGGLAMAVAPEPTGLSVTAMGLNGMTSCGVTSNGIECFGEPVPRSGLGTSDVPSDQTPPEIDETITHVGLGRTHACVLTERAQVWCWGLNDGTSPVGHAGVDGSPQVVDLNCP